LKLTIGSDPEFILIDKSKEIIEAKNYLVNSFEEEDVWDDVDPEIGINGNEILGELRPQHYDDPIKHYRRIGYVLNKTLEFIDDNDLSLLAGSGTCLDNEICTGGHIHFGIEEKYQTDEFYNKLKRSLDICLSIPLLFIEKYPENIYRRTNTPYGSLGSIRTPFYGLEYRTPASWLVTPRITRSVLSLAFSIYNEVFNVENPKLKSLLDLGLYFKTREFVNSNFSIFRSYLSQIIDCLRSLQLYPIYKREMEYLIKRILNEQEWDEYINLYYSWNIKKDPKSPLITQPFIFHEKDKNIEKIKELLLEEEYPDAIDTFEIFGLRKSKEYAFSTNSEHFANLLKRLYESEPKFKEYSLNPILLEHFYSDLCWRNEKRIELGINALLRENHLNEVVEIIKKARKRYGVIK